jgi:hypothetical protein
MMLRIKNHLFASIICSLMLVGSLHYIGSVHSIGVANVVVTDVYWGTTKGNPLNPHPGDVNVQLSIELTNVGDDVARSVEAVLPLHRPLMQNYTGPDGKEHSRVSVSQAMGDMQGGEVRTAVFTVSIDGNAREDNYQYDLQVSYRSARELQQVDKSIAVYVPIWWGDLVVEDVTTSPLKIYPDSKQVQVAVRLRNSGRGAVDNVQIYLELTPPFLPSSSGSDRVFIGNVPAGEPYETDFVVDIQENATFGQYSLTLSEDRNGRRAPIGQVPLYVNEKVNFEILSVTPKDVYIGQTGIVIQVELKNAGSVKADSVRVQLKVGNFFSGTLTDFLGTMIAGEVKVAFFTVDIDAKAQPGQYGIDLRLDWTQEDNSLDHTLTITLNVQQQPFPVIPVVIAIVVIGGVGYFLYRKRFRKSIEKPQEKPQAPTK